MYFKRTSQLPIHELLALKERYEEEYFTYEEGLETDSLEEGALDWVKKFYDMTLGKILRKVSEEEFVKSWAEDRRRRGKGTKVRDLANELRNRAREFEKMAKQEGKKIQESQGLDEGFLQDLARGAVKMFGTAVKVIAKKAAKVLFGWAANHPLGRFMWAIFLTSMGLTPIYTMLLGILGMGWTTAVVLSLCAWCCWEFLSAIMKLKQSEDIFDFLTPGGPPPIRFSDLYPWETTFPY